MVGQILCSLVEDDLLKVEMETHFHDFLTMLRVERNVSTHTMDAYKRDINQYLILG